MNMLSYTISINLNPKDVQIHVQFQVNAVHAHNSFNGDYMAAVSTGNPSF